MISVSDLSVSYGDRKVIADFSANFESGTISAITGSNGVGKSTLLSAIAGEIKAEGSIAIGRRAIGEYSLKELANIRALAVQNHQYWLAYTVEEILSLGIEKPSQTRRDEIIDALSMRPFLAQSVTTLSGGQLQRIEIARALLRQTPILFLDEPFASQDLAMIAQLIEIFKKARTSGVTIILVAHERSEDLLWCDQVINLNS
jgi:iron complex transport system ATP-binding protein